MYKYPLVRSSLFIIVQLALCLCIISCNSRDALVEPYPTDSLGRINRWVLDSMKRFYYWSDAIPARTNYTLYTRQYFSSLLSRTDRFSWISNSRDVQPPSSSYFTYGFHYALVAPSGYDGYVGVITWVNAGGAAERAGLHRGHYFTEVNGEKISPQNMIAAQEALKQPGYVQITRADAAWKPLDTLLLTPGYMNENPVRLTRIFQSGGRITGYLCYNAFNESYDAQLLEAFRKLKEAGAQELVLDLRYNAGGSVASGAKMAAMISAKLTAGEMYAIYQGNAQEGKKNNTLQAVLQTSSNSAGRVYADLQQGTLSLQRVFILTTRATASAAEMVVNNLKPFLTVVQIGETTTGKDEASFTIVDKRIPKQVEWTLQPIVYKLFNKNGEGGYATGIIPQYAVEETASLPLGDIGNSADPLLKQALTIIYGPSFTGEPTNLRRIPTRTVFSSAAEQSAHAGAVQIN